MTLPGIGANTAAALSVYAYNQPCVFIETNIRAVYIHSFFPEADAVSDKQLEPCIQATLYKRNPRRWYNALMDYGVYLKKLHGNPARKSRHHTVQSRFEGSDRQIRGMIIKDFGGNRGNEHARASAPDWQRTGAGTGHHRSACRRGTGC